MLCEEKETRTPTT